MPESSPAAVVVTPAAAPPRTSDVGVWPVYGVEALTSIGSTLLMVGIFFYTQHRYGWGLRENFLLAAAQGVAYVTGALSAGWAARAFGRRRLLLALLAAAAAVALTALAAPRPAYVVGVLMGYTLLVACVWPVLESLVTSDVDAHTLGRRVAIYNLTWSAVNAAVFAAAGTVIEHWPAGMFVIPAASHVAGVLLLLMYREPRSEDVAGGAGAAAAHAHGEPEPELLRARTLALWLSRIALPATYVVAYSLSAMMPLLPVLEPLDTSTRTFVASVWMGVRFLAFILLGATVWWHTRPRVLLAAAVAMLVAFVGVSVRASDVPGFGGVPQAVDLAAMVGWQVALGLVMGTIYAGSLYFGMVLSEGSTEHGGYHEALIGAGSIVGPGVGALAQWLRPDDLMAGVVAVASLVALTVAAAGVATVRARSRDGSCV
jgi:MFS family permease